MAEMKINETKVLTSTTADVRMSSQIIAKPNVSCCLLLEKYIRYVMEAEGSDFIRYGKSWGCDTKFSKEEWDLLTEIAVKVNGS